MFIEVNGERREMDATNVAEALECLGLAEAKVATALNGSFVPASARLQHAIADGDRLEVLAPMQGG